MSAIERIDAVCKYGGFRTLKALAKTIGLKTPQRLYDIQSGKTKDISTDLGEKILLVYQEINPDWVYRGEGAMLKSGNNIQVGGSNFGRIHSDDINMNPDSVVITSADVRELISQNGKLIDIIKELTKKQP